VTEAEREGIAALVAGTAAFKRKYAPAG
jgi:hypothetical protein